MSTIETLFHKCTKRDRKAQEALFKTFSKKMFIHCYRYLKNKEEAEDALTQGFLRVFQNIENIQYQGEKALEGWIKKIMVNEALAFLRKNRTIFFSETAEVENLVSTDNNFTNLCAEDIYKMITTLPTGLRTIFNLYAIEGYSHQEIASMLEIVESTSRSQLMKARRALQGQLIKNNQSHEA